MPSKDSPQAAPAAIDTDADRYPEFGQGMRRIIAEANIPDGPIERLEVTFLANGEATYRVWPARAEEPEGGWLPEPARQ
jgi:hypothetical protein